MVHVNGHRVSRYARFDYDTNVNKSVKLPAGVVNRLISADLACVCVCVCVCVCLCVCKFHSWSNFSALCFLSLHSHVLHKCKFRVLEISNVRFFILQRFEKLFLFLFSSAEKK